jgi:type IV secretion system protein VirB4
MLTEAAGGAFYDLAGPKTDLAFCPLKDIDGESDVQWAVGWIEVLCELNGLKFGPKHRNAVAEAVTRLQLSPTRTLTELSANVQDTDIRDALQHFTVMGPMGSLLDAERDMLGNGRFLSFETENLMQLDDKAVIPVLLYLFRRIEQRLDGSPTLVLLDEAWSYLQHALFPMRRKNAVVVMAIPATERPYQLCPAIFMQAYRKLTPARPHRPGGWAGRIRGGHRRRDACQS